LRIKLEASAVVPLVMLLAGIGCWIFVTTENSGFRLKEFLALLVPGIESSNIRRWIA